MWLKQFIAKVRRRGVIGSVDRAMSMCQERLFDLRYGTNTVCAYLKSLTIDSPNVALGVEYAPMRLRPLRRLMSALTLPLDGTFVDVGCGKGRVLLWAANCGFQRIVGLEFAKELQLDAFAFDAVSYCLALMATSAIATSFQTPKCGVRFSDFLSKWHKDLLAGFRVLSHLPTIYGLVSILIFVDLALAPFLMEIAVLVKLTKNLPPWFLGSLNSCLSLGAICGAVSIKFVCSNNRLDRTIFHGILIMGICIFILPIIPNFLWSFFVIFLIGIGSFWTEIPINTQITLAMPDSLRSRIDAIVGTCCGLMAPLGMLGAGYLMKAFGPQFSVSLSGLLLLLLAPGLFLVPHYSKFFRQPSESADEFLPRQFPKAFDEALL